MAGRRALASFELDPFAILDLLDAVRTRRDTLAAFYQALFDYQSSLLELELATATPIVK